MTDEARIERLTELARRVWPDAAAAVVDGVPSVHEMTDYYGEYIHIARHPRALDALEAALLVLAGEAPLVAAGQNAMCKLAQPAWVEQLASKLQSDADRAQRYGDKRARQVLLDVIAELRERAKGKP